MTDSLRAGATDTLLHAHQTAGEGTTVLLTYELVDEAGNPYVDEAGNPYITQNFATVPVMHVQATDTLLHTHHTAGETNIVLLTYELVDEAGNPYVDEAGNPYVTLNYASVPVMHVQATDTLLHAGE